MLAAMLILSWLKYHELSVIISDSFAISLISWSGEAGGLLLKDIHSWIAWILICAWFNCNWSTQGWRWAGWTTWTTRVLPMRRRSRWRKIWSHISTTRARALSVSLPLSRSLAHSPCLRFPLARALAISCCAILRLISCSQQLARWRGVSLHCVFVHPRTHDYRFTI